MLKYKPSHPFKARRNRLGIPRSSSDVAVLLYANTDYAIVVWMLVHKYENNLFASLTHTHTHT